MGSAPRKKQRFSRQYLQSLVEEATVDCYDETEQALGLFTMIEEHLALPFETTVLGVEVTVDRVELEGETEIVAVCARGAHRQGIALARLPLPSPPPAGAEWVAAYSQWARRE